MVSSKGGKHGYSKKKSARIANAWAKGTVKHRGKRRK